MLLVRGVGAYQTKLARKETQVQGLEEELHTSRATIEVRITCWRTKEIRILACIALSVRRVDSRELLERFVGFFG